MEKTRTSKGISNSGDDLRSICRQVAPYVSRQWREVCEELGVADATLDNIQTDGKTGTKLPELSFRGLCAWLDMVGRTGNKDKLLRAIKACGMRRAEDYLQSLGAKRTVPCLIRPTTVCETHVNKQARKKATLDRLSRPKSVGASEKSTKKSIGSQLNKPNLINLQITPSKPNELCEVKLKVMVQGVQKQDADQMEATRDDFQSTKQNSKNTCHTFVKLVMADQKAHFAKLKELLGFPGISIQRLDKIGFNINLYILCFSLGAFERLYQSYRIGRLKHILHSCLVRPSYLTKIQAKDLELSIQIDDQMVNRYRDILLVRGTSGDPQPEVHPVDFIEDPGRISDEKEDTTLLIRPCYSLKSTLEKLESDTAALQLRYDIFKASINEFLRTLRILRPTNSGTITCFRDILDVHFPLRSSSSTAHVQKDELEEYIAIVNQIRLKTVFIRDHDLEISFDDSVTIEANDLFHTRLAQLENMLQPDFRFSAETKAITETYTGIEQEVFGGVLCYIPDLLTNLTLAYRPLQGSGLEVDKNDNKENDINIENSVPVCRKADYLEPAIYDPPEASLSTQYLKTWTPPILVTFHE